MKFSKMKNFQNEIALLPAEQLSWLMTIKKIFKPTVYYGTMDINDLIFAFKNKAIEKHYSGILALLNMYDFEEYFKN